jgi:hypothetical protein
MALFEPIFRAIGFTKIIKIEGKSRFDQLTKREVGVLIDSFLEGGNEYFDKIAFNEFLHADLGSSDLVNIQEALNRNTFVPSKLRRSPDINMEYLISLSKMLKGE